MHISTATAAQFLIERLAQMNMTPEPFALHRAGPSEAAHGKSSGPTTARAATPLAGKSPCDYHNSAFRCDSHKCVPTAIKYRCGKPNTEREMVGKMAYEMKTHEKEEEEGGRVGMTLKANRTPTKQQQRR